MKYIFLILFLISFSNFSYANSKKDSAYKADKPLADWYWKVGWNASWGAACNNLDGPRLRKKIGNRIALLSWPDYKLFRSGIARWGNKSAAECTKKEYEILKKRLIKNVADLEVAVKSIVKRDEVEMRMELNNLFEEGLITKKVYNKKLKELR